MIFTARFLINPSAMSTSLVEPSGSVPFLSRYRLVAIICYLLPKVDLLTRHTGWPFSR